VNVRSQIIVGCRLSRARESARDLNFRSLIENTLAKQFAEITLTLFQCRYYRGLGRGGKVLLLILKTDKEEKFIAALIKSAEGPEDFLGKRNRTTDIATML
jgi:hypothetical protein